MQTSGLRHCLSVFRVWLWQRRGLPWPSRVSWINYVLLSSVYFCYFFATLYAVRALPSVSSLVCDRNRLLCTHVLNCKKNCGLRRLPWDNKKTRHPRRVIIVTLLVLRQLIDGSSDEHPIKKNVDNVSKTKMASMRQPISGPNISPVLEGYVVPFHKKSCVFHARLLIRSSRTE